ncbi:MAG: hypothetical protein IPG06_13715 [Haliea sp.]|nr:hypothetical protein [Haliea sp.]
MRTSIFCRSICAFLLLASSVSYADSYKVNRLNEGQPIISSATFAALNADHEEGENIQGPSVIRVPDWIPSAMRPSPEARYYLYFAHHNGTYLRMAWAAQIEGPWHLYRSGADFETGHRGVLDMGGGKTLHIGNGVTVKNHIASPDVHVDDYRKLIVMYFHGPTLFHGEYVGQKTFVATSSFGLDFQAGIKPVMRGRHTSGFSATWEKVALSGGGQFDQAPDPYYTLGSPAKNNSGKDLWSSGSRPFEADLFAAGVSGQLRHTAAHLYNDRLSVFYTRIADSPERILLSTVDLGKGEFTSWDPDYPPLEVLRPELPWEGAMLPLSPSEQGAARDKVNQLRDPAIFQDVDGSLYLFYSGGGERAIGLARLMPVAN